MEQIFEFPGVGSGPDPARLHGEHRKSQSVIPQHENFTHFSTCLLNGADGSVVWQHLPVDYMKHKPKVNFNSSGQMVIIKIIILSFVHDFGKKIL